LKKFFVISFLFLLLVSSWAQETETEEGDFFFNETIEEIDEDDPKNTVIENMSRSRVTLFATYNFLGGFAPGWNELPWYDEKEYSYILGAKMEALLGLLFQLSRNLQVWNSFYFSIPPDSNNIFTLKEFYFDYDFNNIFLVRGGQYEVSWGISPFYPFTNLPARIPEESAVGDSYIVKLDIPIGLGGLQFLGMTRYGFMEDPKSPRFNEIAFGAKYNLALSSVDIDFGLYYFKKMPFRFFTSLKTTLGKTEMYVEGLVATLTETRDVVYYSGNLGLVRDFFDGKVTAATEVFYNGEPGAYWYRAKEDIREAESNPLFEGWNGAFSFIIRPGITGMRIFNRLLYSYEMNSLQLVPGISLRPASQLAITLSVPMSLGSRDKNSYYNHNEDFNNRPFSIILGVNISGNFRYRIYMDRSAE
jgi:hypothetical protein